ncbi:S41 family peptidase [Desulfobacterales bacterium HSG2]|nr:S41 family peptidase [Desulfobacterales bacterium HSG2]MDM8548533.1 S41 family peptidase [Desulfobacterales bacterium HSG2]
MKKIIRFIIILITAFAVGGTAYASGNMVASDLWIRAVIHAKEGSPVEAVWQKGGETTDKEGDSVIWGYFHADPDGAGWGSPHNPDMFVKIWFDRSGRLDVSFFHISGPDMDVYSDYPYDGSADEHGTTSLSKRHIRQYYENGRSDTDENDEADNLSEDHLYWPTGSLSGYPTKIGIVIAALIRTPEKGLINPVWRKVGEDTTPEGHKIIWGYFYASPDDVSWGSENNPDIFVKIRFDIGGKAAVDFFHVSGTVVRVYSDFPYGDAYLENVKTDPDSGYVRHEYRISPGCPVEEQNKFVYEVMKDTYLWYDKVPEIDYRSYASPQSLLEDMKYKDLDKWSYITSTEAHYAYFEKGRYIGAGFSPQFDRKGDCRISFVHEDSPADKAGLKRSDKLLEINDKTLSEIRLDDLWNTIFGENEPDVKVQLKIEDPKGGIRELNLEKEWLTTDPILFYDILESNGLKVGYLVFNTFVETALEELDTVFAYFKESEIDELVLDLRYNRGGEISVARHLASLIAGDRAFGKPFAKSVHNSRYMGWNETTRFTKPESALSLDRVVCITTASTCSASELVMNGLEPFVDVISIGDTTRGKPVGMYGWDFCGIHIAPAEFSTVNAQDEGDYFEGIPPACYADDDLTRQFGDTEEASLKEALYYISNGTCTDESGSSRPKQTGNPHEEIRVDGLKRDIGAF